MTHQLLVILHHHSILSIPIDNVVRGAASHTLDQVRLVFCGKLAHLVMAVDGAVEVVSNGVRVKGGNHFVVVKFFEVVVDAVDKVDCAGALVGRDVVEYCQTDWREAVVGDE